VDSLERFQQSRAVIEDFSSRTLAAIANDFGRLSYVSSLKDADSGQYLHEGLTNLYSESAVQGALSHCHEELFSRILETPLRVQERDLHASLEEAVENYEDLIESWRESGDFQRLCPEGMPDYLRDLFCSNLGALLAIFCARKPKPN
jgi:hypothetical protein